MGFAFASEALGIRGHVASEGLESGVWHHLAGTWDGVPDIEHVRLYIDGQLADHDCTNTGSTSFGPQDELRFGAATQFTPFYLTGYLDDVVFYDRVLTETEIESLFRRTD